MSTKRKLLLGAILPVLALAFFAALFDPQARRLRAPERRQWKETAVAEIEKVSGNPLTLSNEWARLRTEAGQDFEAGWIGTNLLVMTNGEWLLYQNKCVKEPGALHDLFLARGSDGKWYYSTFHFCVGMITLRGRLWGENDHGSIADFSSTYALREFDGTSDECLKVTWPVKKKKAAP